MGMLEAVADGFEGVHGGKGLALGMPKERCCCCQMNGIGCLLYMVPERVHRRLHTSVMAERQQ
jgi:hypothetical protein